jgi:hypothetical protein
MIPFLFGGFSHFFHASHDTIRVSAMRLWLCGLLAIHCICEVTGKLPLVYYHRRNDQELVALGLHQQVLRMADRKVRLHAICKNSMCSYGHNIHSLLRAHWKLMSTLKPS